MNYAGLASKIPVEAGGRVTVPTARMRQGDFSELLNPAFTGTGKPIVVYDPLTGQPFPGNIIPANRLDPVAVRYLNAFPLPSLTDRAQQNYFTNRVRDTDQHDADLRIDHRFSDSDTLFLRYSFADAQRFDPGRIPGLHAGFGSGTAEARAHSVAVGHTKVFSPTLINELRAGWVRYNYAFLPVGFGADQNAELGIPGPGGITLPNGISLIGGGNGSFIEYLGDFGQFIVRQRTYQISDSLTWIEDRHNFKVGGTFLIADLESERTQFGKGFYFFSDFTATPGNPPGPGSTGYEVAEMLIGRTAFTATGIPGFEPRDTRAHEISLFVQDDWRVSPELTLNLGLRWDLYTPYYEKDNRMANFVPDFDAAGRITGGRLVLADQGASRATVDGDKDNFAPRLGFAYQIDASTVLRGGWGLFYAAPDRAGADNQLIENPPFSVTAFRFGGPGANVRLSEPIPLPPVVDPANPVLPDGSAIVDVPQDTETAKYHQFNVGVQRAFTPKTALSAAYVGTRGDNLTAIVTRAGFGGAVQGRLTTVANVARSWYDSLQLSLRRTSDDFGYLASYTWSHGLNDSPGPFPGPGGFVVPTIADDLGVDKGNADYDVRHRFTLAANWTLPFAQESALLGGWSLNAIVTLQTGNYFSVFSEGTRADLVGDPNHRPRTAEQWFNTSAFAPASSPAQSSGRNIVEGPPLRSVDLSLFKTFKLGGRANLELRLEGFNVLDTDQYAIPGQFFGSGDFGQVTQTRLNSERQFQVAARVTF